MTVAICLRCGAKKIGALVRCRSCGYEPKEEEEKAKSVLLSDHYLSAADLGNVSERIKSGQGVNFDPTSIENLIEGIRVVEEDGLLGKHTATWLTCGVVLVLGVLLGLVLMAVDYLFGG
jgi:ribosomal protein L40E